MADRKRKVVVTGDNLAEALIDSILYRSCWCDEARTQASFTVQLCCETIEVEVTVSYEGDKRVLLCYTIESV